MAKALKTLSQLKPADYNPREISEEAIIGLRHSIGEFGDLSGIVWNQRTGRLVCGHQRMRVLREQHGDKLKLEGGAIVLPVGDPFPVRVVDVDNATERAMNLAANNPHIAGEFTIDVGAVLDGLKIELPDLFDKLRLGEIEIPQIDAPQDGLTDPDAVPDAPEKPTSEAGDLWIMGDHRLLCGDCTKAEDVERLMGGEKAGVMIADVPYGMRLDADFSGMVNKLSFAQEKGVKHGRKYDNVTGDNADFDAAPLVELFTDVPRQFWFGADYYASTLPDTEHGGAWLVWDKRLDESADKMFGSCFELIWASQRCKRDILRHKWAGIFGTEREPVRGRAHPNQKPVSLLSDLIERGDGGVVDPCAGSGQTIIACEQLNRKCYAMEIEPKYVDVAVRRWEEFTGKKAKTEGGKVMPVA